VGWCDYGANFFRGFEGLSHREFEYFASLTSLLVCTADLFDFLISLIFLVELGIYHSFRLQNLFDYRIAFPLPRQGVVNSLCAFATPRRGKLPLRLCAFPPTSWGHVRETKKDQY